MLLTIAIVSSLTLTLVLLGIDMYTEYANSDRTSDEGVDDQGWSL